MDKDIAFASAGSAALVGSTMMFNHVSAVDTQGGPSLLLFGLMLVSFAVTVTHLTIGLRRWDKRRTVYVTA